MRKLIYKDTQTKTTKWVSFWTILDIPDTASIDVSQKKAKLSMMWGQIWTVEWVMHIRHPYWDHPVPLFIILIER